MYVCMYWFIYYCQYRSNITDNKLWTYEENTLNT